MQDITIIITDRNGITHQLQAPTDMNLNLMELIKMYEIAPDGSIGLCGGMAMCASCQCYITDQTQLPQKSDEEDAMLAEAFYTNANSRLGCQIQICPEMHNLEIVLAPE